MKNLLSEIGGWPVLVGNSWDENGFEFERVFKHLTKNLFSITFPVSMAFSYPAKPLNTSGVAQMLDLIVSIFNFLDKPQLLLFHFSRSESQELL